MIYYYMSSSRDDRSNYFYCYIYLYGVLLKIVSQKSQKRYWSRWLAKLREIGTQENPQKVEGGQRTTEGGFPRRRNIVREDRSETASRPITPPPRIES